MHRRKKTSNIEKFLILLKKIMFYEFYTIKHIKNFEKYGVWCGRTYLKKYGTVLFDTDWYEFFENSRESL